MVANYIILTIIFETLKDGEPVDRDGSTGVCHDLGHLETGRRVRDDRIGIVSIKY
jgi:hypothetical protein